METKYEKLMNKFFYTLLSTSLLMGCSTISNFFDDSGKELPAGAFRGTAAIRNQTVPLPVDIAENILAIENGQLVTEESPAPIQVADNQSIEHPENRHYRRQPAQHAQQPTEVRHPFSGRRRWTNRGRLPAAHQARYAKDGTTTLHYEVKNGDTLMKIAFAKYGDIFRWRDIYHDNQRTIANYNRLVIGSTLVLNGVPFIVIEKNGEPYLIRRGDTLVNISRKLYDSPRYWSSLWKNNLQLIRNPDKIYAGFTLYYRPKSEIVPAFRQPTSDARQ